MAAIIATANNLYNGLRELENVTNTYGGYLQSGGVAYDLVLPFEPDMFQWWRYTTYGTAGTLGQGVWFRDFPAGDSLIQRAIADNGATGNLNLVLETTNGVTINNIDSSFTDTHKTISGATAANPVVITTSTAHGFSTGDEVFITKVVGMTQLNEPSRNPYKITVLTSTTFSLQDLFGNNIDGSAFSAYVSGGQVNRAGPRLGIVNSQPVYRLTLGTAIMGADNDVIYFVATKFNAYQNKGDVA